MFLSLWHANMSFVLVTCRHDYLHKIIFILHLTVGHYIFGICDDDILIACFYFRCSMFFMAYKSCFTAFYGTESIEDAPRGFKIEQTTYARSDLDTLGNLCFILRVAPWSTSFGKKLKSWRSPVRSSIGDIIFAVTICLMDVG